MKILLLEDDFLLNELISTFLKKYYDVDSVYNAQDARNKIDNIKYDIFIFDINLPDISGLDLLQEIREYSNVTPTVFISAYDDMDTLQQAFNNGASDYLKKPFELEELYLRLENIIKIHYPNIMLKIDNNILYDKAKSCVYIHENKYNLTKKENEVLALLITNKNKVLSFDDIYANIWGYDMPSSDTTLRTYIKNIRKIIGKDKIKTIYKFGYVYE
jgi:two-component system OmpR family response regulator